jgi:hypothetical protein
LAQEFISEDELTTFKGWLRYQGFDIATLNPSELEMWRDMFNEARERSLASRKVGLMKLKPVQGEYRYAVAVRDGSDLWLTLWVRRSRKGEIFVIIPRGERDWDPHTSYHRDGTFHSKSSNKTLHSQKRQPLTGAFHGTNNYQRIADSVRKVSGRFAIPPPSTRLSKLPLVCWGRVMEQLWLTS